MQELSKFNKLISNGLEKYMDFNINYKLVFIDSFQFLSFSLESFVKTLGKNDFNYLNQEFDKQKKGFS